MNSPENVGKLKRFDSSMLVDIKITDDDVRFTDPEKIHALIRQKAKMIGLRAESQALMTLKALVESDDDTYAPHI